LGLWKEYFRSKCSVNKADVANLCDSIHGKCQIGHIIFDWKLIEDQSHILILSAQLCSCISFQFRSYNSRNWQYFREWTKRITYSEAQKMLLLPWNHDNVKSLTFRLAHDLRRETAGCRICRISWMSTSRGFGSGNSLSRLFGLGSWYTIEIQINVSKSLLYLPPHRFLSISGRIDAQKNSRIPGGNVRRLRMPDVHDISKTKQCCSQFFLTLDSEEDSSMKPWSDYINIHTKTMTHHPLIKDWSSTLGPILSHWVQNPS
jgi:hypothetical protein